MATEQAYLTKVKQALAPREQAGAPGRALESSSWQLNLKADTWLKGADVGMGRVCLSLAPASVLQLSRSFVFKLPPTPLCVSLCV